MATIVLVPGACLGAWAWSEVTPRLEAAGHDVHPLTLTGLGGQERDADVSGVDLSVHGRDVVALLEREELRDVVLVGHSYSGGAITAAAELAPERIARLVYLDAEIPQDGVSAFAGAGPEFEGAITSAAEAGGDPTRVPFFTDAELETYYGEHELTAEQIAAIRTQGAGHPIAGFHEALDLTNADAAALPRTYVTCLRRSFPSPVDAATPGWSHVTLDAGHWPMFSQPAATAEVLDRVARG
ncbi:alpha/beta fold hydrolase [Conexibacter woesei]|uniref:Putative esterase n=1 Tax=Conexibacter woesei (strain DSM 14684 / CCUG 47730 / CIP 108061 / JCM 11494 / NBRC 100937 / ID131577) TaxID=469383 RepID=D3EZ64_CONWI|nr:alpha/beta fold hydrolase [Conexibacter woesei]ADB51829.1 putative esterase [Conexibacter woesei DSM 14684]